jgi:putative PIN family toxin of toxin-antitoxin system
VNRLVTDTNIFVSGTATANTPPAQILDLWRNGSVVLITSPQLLAEANDVLTRSKIMAFTGLSVEETQSFLQEIAKRSFVTAGEYHIEPLMSNPADTAVLQAAVEGQATHIVTGDKKHLLPLKEIQGIPILTPKDYLSRFHK